MGSTITVAEEDWAAHDVEGAGASRRGESHRVVCGIADANGADEVLVDKLVSPGRAANS